MAGEIATAFVSIIPSFKGGATALTKQLNSDAGTAGDTAGKTAGGKFSGSFGTAIKGVGGILAGAFAVGAVTDFFGSAISGASDLNETVSKSKVIFGDQFAALDGWSDKAATNLGLSKQAALDAASGFGDMFTQLGFAGDTAALMSQDVVGLSADLGSFNNLPTEDVSQRIAAAFRGEYDSLQALIPNINAARVEQEAMTATGKTNAKELTAQEKAAAVLAIVHKDGAKAAGDFARTSDGLANSQKIASAQFADAKTKLGNLLLPAMTAVTRFASTALIPAFIGIVDAVKGIGKFVADNATAFKILAVAVGVVAAAVAAHTLVLAINSGALKAWFLQSKIVQVATKAWAAVQWILNAALTANPIALVVIAIAALVAGIILAWKHSETFRNIVIGAWTAIKAFVMPIIGWFTTAIPAAWQWIKDATTTAWAAVAAFFTAWWGALTGFFTTALELVTGVLSTAWDAITTAVTTVWSAIAGFFTAWWDALSGLFTAALDAVVAFLTQRWDNIKTNVTTVWNAITGFLTTAWATIKALITAAVDAVVAFLVQRWDNIKANVSTAWTAIKGLISGAWDGIKSLITTALDTIKGWIDTAWNSVKGLTAVAWDAIKSAVSTKIGEMVGFVAGIPGKILAALGDLGNLLYQAGRNVIQGLIDGIGDMIGKLGDIMGDVAGEIGDFLPWSPAKKGPLRKHPPQMGGRNIGRMLAEGLLSEKDAVARAAGVLAGAVKFDGPNVRAPRGTSNVRAAQLAGANSKHVENHLHLTVPAYVSERQRGSFDKTALFAEAARVGLFDMATA